MAEDSKIEWTHHTFNPWRGCTKVSSGCANCYAETLSGRNPKTLGVWGPNGTRVVAAEAQWREPLKWNKAAEEAGERHRVFCASLADVFEDWRGPMTAANGNQMWMCHGSMSNSPIPSAWNGTLEDGCRMVTMDDIRQRLFDTIAETPQLDWLLLTKRPENVLKMTYESWCPKVSGHVSQNEIDGRHWKYPPNVWLGASVENQAAADARIPHLLATPAAVRFLSCEPLLGPVDLTRIRIPLHGESFMTRSALHATDGLNKGAETPGRDKRVDWVIVGGESGAGARPMQIEWARDLVRQCKAASVPVFVKQMGAAPTGDYYEDREFYDAQLGREWPDALAWNHRDGQPPNGSRVALPLFDKKGGAPAEWPADLRVREFPKETE